MERNHPGRDASHSPLRANARIQFPSSRQGCQPFAPRSRFATRTSRSSPNPATPEGSQPLRPFQGRPASRHIGTGGIAPLNHPANGSEPSGFDFCRNVRDASKSPPFNFRRPKVGWQPLAPGPRQCSTGGGGGCHGLARALPEVCRDHEPCGVACSKAVPQGPAGGTGKPDSMKERSSW